ncbi:MAG: efflux RND transporter periplasmic adaptor subunit [Thermodesulfobacteriota bacterium]
MNKQTSGGTSPFLYIILLVVGVAIGGAIVYLYFEETGSKPMESATAPVKERKIKYWQAPMDPAYIRDAPGKSPMGMELVPVYEGEVDILEPGTVRIDPVTAQNIGVRTEKVQLRRLTRLIRAAGRVSYDEKRVHHVNTKIEGWVEKLYVDFTGQEVKKDDYLLEIYSPKLVATQEEYLLAKKYADSVGNASAGDGSTVLELTKRRLELWDVPAHQIRELEETGEIKRTIHVHSPASGIVVNKKVQEGMFVKPGVMLYTIADLSKVWVYADLYEYEFAWIKEGQEALMTLAAYPGEEFSGKVAFINPFMEPKTRTVKVRLEFDNPHGKLKPDMFTNVEFKSKRKKSSIAVPTEAVLLSGERSVVIVARGFGKFTPREVTLGVEAGGFYEVKDGLTEGEEIVTSAHFLIDSESRLKEAISKMLELKEEDKPKEHEDMDHGDMEEMDHEEMNHEEMGEMDHSNMEEMDHSGMEEMDHSNMEGMDHDSMDHSGMGEMNHD